MYLYKYMYVWVKTFYSYHCDIMILMKLIVFYQTKYALCFRPILKVPIALHLHWLCVLYFLGLWYYDMWGMTISIGLHFLWRFRTTLKILIITPNEYLCWKTEKQHYKFRGMYFSHWITGTFKCSYLVDHFQSCIS